MTRIRIPWVIIRGQIRELDFKGYVHEGRLEKNYSIILYVPLLRMKAEARSHRTPAVQHISTFFPSSRCLLLSTQSGNSVLLRIMGSRYLLVPSGRRSGPGGANLPMNVDTVKENELIHTIVMVTGGSETERSPANKTLIEVTDINQHSIRVLQSLVEV